MKSKSQYIKGDNLRESFTLTNLQGVKLSRLFVVIYLFCSIMTDCNLIPAVYQQWSFYAFLLGTIVYFFVTQQLRIDLYGIYYGIVLVTSALLMVIGNNHEWRTGTFYSMLICFILVFCIQFFIHDKDGVKAVAYCYVVASIVVVGMLMVSGRLSGTADNRLGQEAGGNANVFATTLMYAVIYGMWLFTKEKREWIRLVLLIVIIADWYTMSLTGGRKYIIVPLIFLLVMYYENSEKSKGDNKLAKLMLIFIAIIAVYFLIMRIPVLYNSVGIRMEGLFASITGRGKADMSAEIRKEMREIAIAGWLKSPLWGYGLDTFKYLCDEQLGLFCYSHCNYTEILYSGGIIYFCIYYSLPLYVLYQACIHRESKDGNRAFIIGAVLAVLAYDYGQVSYTMLHSQLFMAMISVVFLEQRVVDIKNTRNKVKNRYLRY